MCVRPALYGVQMDHFPIVKSLLRVALAQGDETVRHQAERLVVALQKSGDQDAEALERLLSAPAQRKTLTPSRLTRSGAGVSVVPPKRERLVEGVALPVDRESYAPLATVVFPESNTAEMPLLPTNLNETFDNLLLEWENADRLHDAGLSPSLSCLIYGPPGTGKTTLAMWLAKRLEVPAVVARLDGLISSYLGTTARNIGSLFDFARRYECVLVLDEFDAIAKLRDDPNEVGEIKRVVNTLLQNIDSRAHAGITIGITNHQALLDPAVWRRFEVQVSLPLPSYKRRLQIAEANVSPGAPETLTEMKLLAWLSEGLSGAEVVTMCRRLRKQALLNSSNSSAPALRIAQVAASTSSRDDTSRVSRVIGGDASAIEELAHGGGEWSLSHGELAYLYGVSTKTISRRLSEVMTEGKPRG
jgi:hypothetical protein